MKGIIKNIPPDREFAFVRGEDGVEYFLHRMECLIPWGEVTQDFKNKKVIKVEFEGYNSPKGPRAGECRRINE